MVVNRANADLKQLGHLRLCKPQALVLQPAMDLRPAVFRLVQEHHAN
jgi:hypothetical protein